MMLLSNLELIRRIPLFAVLNAEQAQRISNAVEKRNFKRGQTLVRFGERSNMLFILLTGSARVFRSDERGREVILATLHPGEYFGEMSLIDNGSHSASVRAEANSDVLTLGCEDFAGCLPANSSLSYAILRGLVQRLRAANHQITSLALLDVYGRVARGLLDMAVTSDGVSVIRGKVSRQDLAKVVGASREMVSRVMAELEVRGAIQTIEKGWVLIKEPLVT